MKISRFEDETGATSLEYSLLLSLLAIAALFSLVFVGSVLDRDFRRVGRSFNPGSAAAQLGNGGLLTGGDTGGNPGNFGGNTGGNR